MPTHPPSAPLSLCWAGSICSCPHSSGLQEWPRWGWNCQTSFRAPGSGASREVLAVTTQHSAVQHSYPPNAFHTQQIELLWSSHFFFFFFQHTKLFSPLFLDKEFCHMLQINCNLSDALLQPTSWAAFKKKKSSLSISVSAPTKLKLKHSAH